MVAMSGSRSSLSSSKAVQLAAPGFGWQIDTDKRGGGVLLGQLNMKFSAPPAEEVLGRKTVVWLGPCTKRAWDKVRVRVRV